MSGTGSHETCSAVAYYSLCEDYLREQIEDWQCEAESDSEDSCVDANSPEDANCDIEEMCLPCKARHLTALLGRAFYDIQIRPALKRLKAKTKK